MLCFEYRQFLYRSDALTPPHHHCSPHLILHLFPLLFILALIKQLTSDTITPLYYVVFPVSSPSSSIFSTLPCSSPAPLHNSYSSSPSLSFSILRICHGQMIFAAPPPLPLSLPLSFLSSLPPSLPSSLSPSFPNFLHPSFPLSSKLLPRAALLLLFFRS